MAFLNAGALVTAKVQTAAASADSPSPDLVGIDGPNSTGNTSTNWPAARVVARATP